MKRERIGLYRDCGLYIDGDWRPVASGAYREVLYPTSEEFVGMVKRCSEACTD